MGLYPEFQALYNGLIESQNLRMVQYPNTAAGFNLISDNAAAAGAYRAAAGVIVAAAALANPCWIIGISLGQPVVEAFRATFTILEGAVEIIRFGDIGTNVFPVLEWTYPHIYFPWKKVLASPALNFNIEKDTGASLAGWNNCHIIALTGVGS